MGYYSAEYDKETHKIRIKEYIPGCGSIDSETRTVVGMTINDAMDFKSSFDIAFKAMEVEEGVRQNKHRENLVNRRKELLAEIDSINKELLAEIDAINKQLGHKND